MEQARKKVKELEVMVAEVIRETPDASTLVLFTGNDPLDYQAGHFIAIDPHQFPALERFTQYLEDVKGKKEKPRAYSLASAPHEQHLAITIKEERYVSGETPYPPLLSPIMVHRIPIGFRMRVTGFTGPYTLKPEIIERNDHILHVCAGSGVVPSYSIIKESLHQKHDLRHTLVFSTKKEEDIIYREHLEQLCDEHENFEVLFRITREDGPFHSDLIEAGRVNEELLRSLVDDVSKTHAFICGPGITKWDKMAAKKSGEAPKPRFLEAVRDALHAIGFDKKSITEESYG